MMRDQRHTHCFKQTQSIPLPCSVHLIKTQSIPFYPAVSVLKIRPIPLNFFKIIILHQHHILSSRSQLFIKLLVCLGVLCCAIMELRLGFLNKLFKS